MKHLKIYESEELEDDDDVMDNLLSILRKFIKNAGYEPYVSYDGDSISVDFILSQTETMPSLMKVMNLLNKLHTDILIQYECEFELAETTDFMPLLTASFYYSESATTRKSREKDNDDDDKYISGDKFPF